MSSRTLLIASCALALFTGCSSPGVRPGSKVTGTVKYKGTPVAGAKVIFTDGKDGASPTGPTATTDEDGAYAVVGVPPGSYKVVVYKLEAKKGGKIFELSDGMDLEQLEASGMGTHALPKKYASPSTTNLVAQVQEGSHKEDFDLK